MDDEVMDFKIRMKLVRCLVVLPLLHLYACDFLKVNNLMSSESARINCEARGMELAMMSSKQEYEAVKTLYADHNPHKVLIGLRWNSTLHSYQWYNGKVLGNINWASGELGLQSCVAVRPNGKWYTLSCSTKIPYVCRANSGIIHGNQNVDFYTAHQLCTDIGGTLPVIISGQDENYDSLVSLSNDVWLGLYKDGETFKWLTGEEVSQSFTWMDKNKHLSEAHIEGPFNKIHVEDKDHSVLCQSKSMSGRINLTNQFYLVSDKALVIGTHLKKFTSTSKTGCARECSKTNECYLYTRSGVECTLYGDFSYVTVPNGKPLWKRNGGDVVNNPPSVNYQVINL